MLGATRLLIAFLVLAAVAASAQPPNHRIGYLSYGARAESERRVKALTSGLRDHGYIEGKNVEMLFRWGESAERLPELAAELVRLKVDLIFAPTSTEVEAARQATTTIPIVFGNHADPVGVGHVASLARPGGNVTGMSVRMTEIVAKQLEILKQVLPQMKRVAALGVTTAPSTAPAFRSLDGAAHELGVQVVTIPVHTPAELESAFATMVRERVSAFVAMPSPLLRSHRGLVAQLALQHRVPGMFGPKDNVEAGGLMSYFPDPDETNRRAATYIDKIFKGAKPADLPVEQASKYDLVINVKTARALGIAIPPGVLLRAEQVLE